MTCPTIAAEAYQLGVQHIHQSRDPGLYQNLLSAYEQAQSYTQSQLSEGATVLPDPLEIAQLDTRWMDETLARNTADRGKLEVELKTYTNNMIKESIRVSIQTFLTSICFHWPLV